MVSRPVADEAVAGLGALGRESALSVEGTPRWTTAAIEPIRRRAASPLERLRAVVLLGGSLRSTALRAAIQRSVVDLPVESQLTLLGCWRKQCIALSEALGARGLPVRLILDRAAAEPHHGWVADERVILSVERDPVEYRGTGGVLRDLAGCYAHDEYVLVGNAAQLLRSPLLALALELGSADGDVVVVSHSDGTPSGLMLVRCGCLREIAPVGFVDMKEQALPAIARRHRVHVVERPCPSGLPIRTLADYIEALRRHHRDLLGMASGTADLEDWRPAFALVEPGASVHPASRIHNSVILRGARVEEGAAIVGSVVCGGAVIRRGRMISDELASKARA